MGSEDPLLLQTEKGLTARIGNVFLYPPEDPSGYARRRALTAEIAPRTLYFIPSAGLGYGLTELLARVTQDSRLLCVEVDQRVMALAATAGLPMDPRLILVRTDSTAAVAGILAGMGPGRFRRVVNLPLSAGYRLNPGLYSGMLDILSQGIRTFWRNRMTLIGMGSLYVRNLFDNLGLLAESADFGALETEKPIVVCGAGPSLDLCIPLLARLRRRFLLAAADTALPALAARALIPDLIVTLEAQHANLSDFIPFRDPRIPMACDLTACPAVLRRWAGSLAFFSSAFAPVSVLQRLRNHGLLPLEIPALGSVGVAAAYAAGRLTRGKVYLAGLDFSYPGSMTHARGTPTHLAMLAGARRCRSVEQAAYASFLGRPRVRERDKYGGMITTDTVLRSYRDQLENIVQENAGRVTDIGALGLPLGVRHVGLEEADAQISAAPESREDLKPHRGAGTQGDMGAFVRGEKKALADAEEMIRTALDSGDPAAAAQAGAERLHAVDYAFIHFPDFPEPGRVPGKSFLARALVAVRYYSERMKRLPA
jgi:hypothetical protein